ncbi:MAG: hypothetical protein ACRDQ5_07320, partial [Sciscionella sp.]
LVCRADCDATAFALVFSGRMEPTAGAVLLNGTGDAPTLRELVAVVDAPGVSEPEPTLPLSAVVAEELALASAPADRAAVDDWLQAHGVFEFGDHRFENIPAAARTDLLVELATARPGVQVLMLDTPDRHTGDPDGWWSCAIRQARRGVAVVVLCADPVAHLLSVSAARLGQLEQPAPLRVVEPDESAGWDPPRHESLDPDVLTGTLPYPSEDA